MCAYAMRKWLSKTVPDALQLRYRDPRQPLSVSLPDIPTEGR